MTPIVRALARSLVTLAHPKILLLMLLPVALAVVIWLALGVMFWSQAVDAVNAALQSWPSLQGLQQMIGFWPLTLIAAHVAVVLLLVLMIPVVLVTTVLIVGVLAMPFMVSHVAARDYARVEERGSNNWLGSFWNSIAGLLIFLLLVVATSPLWLFPPVWPVLSLGLLAYLNQRVLRYDAVVMHATPAEMKELMSRERLGLYVLGALVALATHIPILGFFAPVFGALVFVHFLLDRLEALRDVPLVAPTQKLLN